MSEPVVVAETEFSKGARDGWGRDLPVRWIPAPPEEGGIARAIRDAGARIAVLGAHRYRGELYGALRDAAGGRPALIARFGVGYDGIEQALCRECGILLTTTPGALDRSVAEHAMALLLSAARRVASSDRGMRAGGFSPETGWELSGKTLCVAGFGAIGRHMARIASAGFAMRVIAFSRTPLADRCRTGGDTPEGFLARHGLAEYCGDYESAASQCDILSIHMPAGPATRRFFGGARLQCLKPTAILINTSRGSLLDESALFWALSLGRLGYAGLDVFATEPYVPEDPACDLRTLPNVVLTPHAASNTVEANRNMQRLVCENIAHFLGGRIGRMNTVGGGI